MRRRYSLNLEESMIAVQAAIEVAGARGWGVTIAIVDDAGHAVHLARMDEASPASVDTALAKAQSAALTGLDTAILEAMVADRPGVATLGRVAVEGGLPLLFAGQRVGGVGVSGRQSHEDREIADHACSALTKSWASKATEA